MLDQDILDQGLITPVTVVASKDMTDTFLKAVTEVSERAKREHGSLLLMVFCHGLEGHLFKLGGPQGPATSITILQGALEKYVPVCLLTTACYSGGWSISPDINISTMTGAGDDTESTSWPASQSFGRFSGSVFASSVIQSMASATTDLAKQVGTDDVIDDNNRLMNLDQETAQTLQTQTYNEFCHAVWRSCRGLHRLWRDHTFTFSAQGDEWDLPWNQASSIPLASYAERWGMLKIHPYNGSAQAKQNLDPSPNNPAFEASDLGDVQQGCLPIDPTTDNPTTEETGMISSQDDDSQISSKDLDDPFLGPLISSLYRRRVEEMVHLWRQTCPGDANKSNWHSENYFMNRCLETGQVTHVPSEDDLWAMEEMGDEFVPLPRYEYNLADIIEYRLNMAQLAQHILARLGLPRPSNQSCLAWYELSWSDRMVADPTRGFADVFDVRKEKTRLFKYVHSHEFLGRLAPMPQQGPRFHRFHRYLIAGVIEAHLTSADEEKRVMSAILDMISEAEKFYEQRALADPEVRRLQKKYLEWFRR